MKSTALLLHPLPNEWVSLLEGRVHLMTNADEDPHWFSNLQVHLPNIEGIISLLTDRIDHAFLQQAARLRVVSNMAVGVANIDIQAYSKRGIPVGNTPGTLTDATADLAFALILTAARKLNEASRDAREERWNMVANGVARRGYIWLNPGYNWIGEDRKSGGKTSAWVWSPDHLL